MRFAPASLISLFALAGPAWAQTETSTRVDLAPTAGMVEITGVVGLYLPPDDHELYDSSLMPQRQFENMAPSVGLRLGVFPLAWFGLEAEGLYMPTSINKADSRVNLFRVGGHLVAQLPGRFTPFILAGGSSVLLDSGGRVLGADADAAFHWGVGGKFYLNRWWGLRVDARHILTAGEEADPVATGGASHHFEVLAGLVLTLGRDEPPPPPDPDADKDGVLGAADICPSTPGVPPDGCPPKDTDGDGKIDAEDRCLDVPSAEPDGCPPPDTDKDGRLDRDDACPNEAGTLPNGCPDLDPDKDSVNLPADQCPDQPGPVNGCPDQDNDGLADKDDRCATEPETKNGYQESDGCPDELPKAIKKFVGTIAGITFPSGSAKIAPSSFATLDAAVKVLNDYPELRLEVSGHTDDVGVREANVKLSQERAEAVRAYFVSKGIGEERVVAVGHGPDKPVADNKTKAGKAANRRIEFALITPS
jgi:outer membrane protein OmpA-like peptidoglycan-associated protein